MGETVSKPRIVIEYRNDYRLLDTAVVLGGACFLTVLVKCLESKDKNEEKKFRESKNALITELEQQLRDLHNERLDEFGEDGR